MKGKGDACCVTRNRIRFCTCVTSCTDYSGQAVRGVGLGPLAFWDCGFEFGRGHRCLSVVSVVFCQVEASATGRSLVQRLSTVCGVSECDCEASKMSSPGPLGTVTTLEKY